VSKAVKSYKELPLLLYQITRKYRDEFRPRHGLLRGREFVMKDLYTFDMSIPSALTTYEKVGSAYREIFAEMKLPVLVAEASSGDMGGDLSHEYHLPTSLGEDHVVSCDSCDYVINDELATIRVGDETSPATKIRVWRGISKDRATLVNVWYPESTESPGSTPQSSKSQRMYADEDVNVYAIKSVMPDLDAGIEDPLPFWSAAIAGPKISAKKMLNIVDVRLPSSFPDQLKDEGCSLPLWPETLRNETGLPPLSQETYGGQDSSINTVRIQPGDHCPRCASGTLNVQKAIELGHTFHLGTRYSTPLEATIMAPASVTNHVAKNLDAEKSPNPAAKKDTDALQAIPMQMGCHGIGVSRIIGAVADHLMDKQGLNWPAAIAPYTCVIVPGKDDDHKDAASVYELLTEASRAAGKTYDAIVDERKESLPRRLTDADLIGVPVIIVLGREWRASQRLEVQCRRLGVKTHVGIDELPQTVMEMLDKL
jgi:prolyl-tRNA synthetase